MGRVREEKKREEKRRQDKRREEKSRAEKKKEERRKKIKKVHQWIRSAIRDSQQPISSIGFLFLKLPPPPCAVLLV
jgi:hypothetical protein